MQYTEYITLVLHNHEVMQYFADKGIVELGTIYNTMHKIDVNEKVDLSLIRLDVLAPLIDKYLET